MTKAQIAAVFLAGTASGVAGKQIVESVTSTASAAAPTPFTHAVDLRRDYQSAATPKVTVYGNVKVALDAGVKDVGQASSCAPAAATAKDCAQCMNGLSRDCRW